jgi:hypothetical protein
VPHCSVKLRAAAIFLGIAIAGGCAAPREAVKTEKRKPESPVSVRLPVLSPLKIESPPTVPPPDQAITPSDVQDGIARSTKMFEFNYTSGKGQPPPGESAAPLEEEAMPDVERP